jgi:hypothetical protein
MKFQPIVGPDNAELNLQIKYEFNSASQQQSPQSYYRLTSLQNKSKLHAPAENRLGNRNGRRPILNNYQTISKS